MDTKSSDISRENDTKTSQAYSLTLPKVKRQLVQRIQLVTDGDIFRTRQFSMAFDDSERKNDDISAGTQWREARKNPESGLWTVRDYKTTSRLYTDEDGNILENETPIQRQTILSDLCFFDALYLCASFELAYLSGALDMAAAGPSKGALGAVHYRAFGEEQGMVFDKKSHFPVPVIDGEILELEEEPALTTRDLEISERARGNLAGSAAGEKRRDMLVPINKAGANTPASVDDMLDTAGDMASLKAHHDALTGKIDDLAGTFNALCETKGRAIASRYDEEDFFAGAMPLISGVSALGMSLYADDVPKFAAAAAIGLVCLGLSGIYSVLKGNKAGYGYSHLFTGLAFSPDRRFKKQIKALRDECKSLPGNSALQKSSTDMADLFEQEYHTLAVRYAFNRHADKNSAGTARLFKKRMQALENAYKAQGYEDSDIQSYLQAIRDEREDSSLIAGGGHEFMNIQVEKFKKALENGRTQAVKQLTTNTPLFRG